LQQLELSIFTQLEDWQFASGEVAQWQCCQKKFVLPSCKLLDLGVFSNDNKSFLFFGLFN